MKHEWMYEIQINKRNNTKLLYRRILNKKKIVHSQGNEALTLHYLRVSCEEWLPCEEHSTERGKKGCF